MRFPFFIVLSLFLVSCTTGEDEIVNQQPIDFRAQNEEEIRAYLAANDLVSQQTESGLHYIIENQGDGAQPTATSNVLVAYTGSFLNGAIFDQSADIGLPVSLDQVIPGWTEGIPLFKVGGSGKLIIPSHLGYGSFNYRAIPGGSVLIFDIELLAIN